MVSATTQRIRNVAVVGHSGAGKTTLVEALLHRAGAIARPGRVEDGSTVCDHEPEEVTHGISIGLGVASAEWTASDGETYALTFLDTPGYADFVGARDAALGVAGLALVVVSAVDGVQVGTEAAWRACAEAGLARLVVVTQEDKARADFHRVLDELRAAFGDAILPLELPLGEESAFRGVADVLSDRAYAYDGANGDGSGRGHDEPVPPEVADEEHRLHEELTEEIVTHDDDQLERYLAGDAPAAPELERTFARQVAAGEAVGVLCCSGATGVGVDRLADLLCEIGPSPAARPAAVTIAGEASAVEPDAAADPLLHVFRTVADPFVGQVSVFKVLSGTVPSGGRLANAATGAEERLHGLFRLRGREHLPVERLVAGEIGAVAKLAATSTGTLLAARRLPVSVSERPRRAAVYALALEPVSQADDDKLSSALARLTAEDPTLRSERVDGQSVLAGLGDTHLAVALERLARVFGVRVTTAPVRIPFRETIARSASAQGRLKKQSGGHGQFAVVELTVAPLPRGGGFELIDSVVGGAIPRSYLPAVRRGLVEAMADGGPHGYPVVDVAVEVTGGKSHSVDSSDMAFRTAAALGLKEALAAAGTIVLEPVSEVAVVVPSATQGDVLGDLSARRGHITSSVVQPDGWVRIEASVPASELVRYALDLRSLTGGRGEFTALPASYDVLPSHLVGA
ncbi:small GTP-binding protein [Beutenbergia cavernae DSM 12333]|uniref:Small GTP-binding protein n=1 Tax=Beutenbergia cavernae (strain ATCC BAA-8 / DSM 12333 / CCUG 43141 / JCM 11478 / NBRC 16432 / NCIMB 13614 / HKI 0122) TaxID=471853 RepID=C5C3N5_BEUC1|nr:elongation factor G [Beutenbergia cavernae]ACQ81944.1 small GTP-binding protein [Beutenbergia cavernae DSM 12333]